MTTESLRDALVDALVDAHRTHPCPVTGDVYWSGCWHPDQGKVGACHEERRADAVLDVILPRMSRLLLEKAELADALAEYERMTPQSCAKGVHTDWAADTSLSLFCPWCLLAELRAERKENSGGN